MGKMAVNVDLKEVHHGKDGCKCRPKGSTPWGRWL